MIDIKKEDIIKELEMIQSCISRMSKNSFSMKGWHITILSALILLFFNVANVDYKALGYLIIAVTIMFWFLDSFYLLQERKYRWKYQWVLDNRLNSNKINAEHFMNMNVNNSKMWVSASNSFSYRLAIFSSDRKHAISRYFFKLIEVCYTMLSKVMQMEYMIIVFIVSAFLLFY